MIINTTYRSPIGYLNITILEQVLTNLNWSAEQTFTSHDHASHIHHALDNYFHTADLNQDIFKPQGSTFQRKVWQRMITIPKGSTISYGQLAKELNTSARAIGQACKSNPILLFIPCHRVVAKTHLGGYISGTDHLDKKEWLLDHEQSNTEI